MKKEPQNIRAAGLQFNNLTPKEHEALTILFEECSEVIQIIGKINRHGLESYHPKSGDSNRVELIKEIGDVFAAVELVVREGIVIQHQIDAARQDKISRYRQHPEYLHHIDPL